MIGTTISHYEILVKLGEGGMGVVYKAHDTKLDRVVALKFLPASSKVTDVDRARFVQEARTAAAINHPNICTIYNIEEHDDRQFIVMEYVAGETLHARIRRQPSLTVDEVVEWAEQIGEGLHEAHSHGIIHRDIKSENIMVNSKNQIKVMDFGLAKLKDSIRVTRLSSTVGTLGFMAPELIQGGDADARSDIFSFGVVMYEMLAGRLPFRGEHDAAIIYSIVNEEPLPLAEPDSPIASTLQKTIMNCLVKEPAQRYQTVSEILADLQGEATGKESRTIEAREIWSYFKQKKSLLAVGTVASLAAIIAATYFLSPTAFKFSPEKKSIAVLPFKNMSPEKESEYFSDGVTEDIIAQISKIGDIKVISRTSAMRYKQTEKSMRDIANELDVATVLEGSVRKAGNRVRIVAQLIDASEDEHLWAETYDAQLTEIFAIQSDVALKIATALKATLSPTATEKIATPPTTDVTAYQLYLKGRQYYYRYRKEDNEQAIALFKRAVAHDPRYALAYAGLADTYGQLMARYGYPLNLFDSSLAASTMALSVQPDLAEAYKAQGLAYQVRGWTTKALGAYRKAVEYNPNYPPAVGNLGVSLTTAGQLDEALQWLLKSVQIDPTNAYNCFSVGDAYLYLGDDEEAEKWFKKAAAVQPEFPYSYLGIAHMYLNQRRFDESLAMSQKLVALDPGNLPTLNLLGYLHTLRGDFEKARQSFAHARTVSSPHGNLAGLGYLAWKTGKREEARAKFDTLLASRMKELDDGNEAYEARYDIAVLYAVQGHKREALEWLQRSIDAGLRDYRLMSFNPLLENLHGEDAFKRMIGDMKARVDSMRAKVNISSR